MQTVMRADGRAGFPLGTAYRLEVVNVPQYLHHDEVRSQFVKCGGFLDSGASKDAAGCALMAYCAQKAWQARAAHQRSNVHWLTRNLTQSQQLWWSGVSNVTLQQTCRSCGLSVRRVCSHYHGWFVDFDSPQNAQRCIDTYTAWKGWGPKGLAFNVVGPISNKRGAIGMHMPWPSHYLRMQSSLFSCMSYHCPVLVCQRKVVCLVLFASVQALRQSVIANSCGIPVFPAHCAHVVCESVLTLCHVVACR
jgi:hypothetical protein